MEVDKQERDIIKKALDNWVAAGELDAEQAASLQQSITIKHTQRHQIAQYFFIVAISCMLLAFGAIFIDDKLLEKLKSYFALSNVFIALVSAILAAAWFWYLRKRKRNFGSFSYEVYMVLGGLASLTALVYFCKDIGFGPENTVFLSLSAITLFCLGTAFRSKLLWLAALVSVVGLWGSFTTWQNSRNLFWGMNYPVRFVFISVVLLALSLFIKRFTKLHFAQRLTYISALLLFFVSMWMVSVFGNYGYLDEWAKVRQVQVIGYALAFGLLTAGAFYLGIKYSDNTTRDLAVVFLLLNLYSRYFEYFWDNTNKGIFFLILAVSFWLIGRWIEKARKQRNPH